jgi:hypothetical protein
VPGRNGMSASGASIEYPHCGVHSDVTMMVHPRQWGWVCPRCRAAGQSTRQPYPFVPLPPLRPDRPVAQDLDLRPASHPASVPSLTRESASRSQQHPRTCASQTASKVAQQPASVSLKATVDTRPRCCMPLSGARANRHRQWRWSLSRRTPLTAPPGVARLSEVEEGRAARRMPGCSRSAWYLEGGPGVAP